MAATSSPVCPSAVWSNATRGQPRRPVTVSRRTVVSIPNGPSELAVTKTAWGLAMAATWLSWLWPQLAALCPNAFWRACNPETATEEAAAE